MGNKKMGRPTDNPKNVSIKFKADDETVRKLQESSEELNVSKAEVLRKGVHKVYDDLKK
ncbi:MAG: CopG family transcriptional regulator [Oscillospiraceae bacterium]|nr:CopG family transcriptional regulator [Oscillospiraceae bacterium]